jgi:hypothetical protein
MRSVWTSKSIFRPRPYHFLSFEHFQPRLGSAKECADLFQNGSIWKRSGIVSAVSTSPPRVHLPKPRVGHSANCHYRVDIASETHDLCPHCGSFQDYLISPGIGELWWSRIRIVGHPRLHILGRRSSVSVEHTAGGLKQYRLRNEDRQGACLAEDACTIDFGDHAVNLPSPCQKEVCCGQESATLSVLPSRL